MDGFAVRDDTLTPGIGNLAIAGTTYAGGLPGMPLDRHMAWRITTGAPVPTNADRVIPFELVEERAECISLLEPLPMGRHIRKRATDFSTGQILLDAGTLLDPARLIVATASDQPFAVVHRRPRLRIVASGDELSPAGEAAARTMGVPDSLTDALLLFTRVMGSTEGRSRFTLSLADDFQSRCRYPVSKSATLASWWKSRMRTDRLLLSIYPSSARLLSVLLI
jgi:molybdopterin molybdotransferase